MVRVRANKTLLETRPFAVEELQVTMAGKDVSAPYYRLRAPDWANILAVTADQRAVLIRQPRVGALKAVLETPGGVVEAHERDATLAAVRELEEETGFTSQRILSLGSLNPNPAIMNNRCHFFLALGCVPAAQRRHFPDAEEHIELVLVPVQELDGMVRRGEIDHALAALCIMLASKYVDTGHGK